MADISFRKIDIDQYDEDVIQENELYEADARDPTVVHEDAKRKAGEVRSALAKNDIVGALTIVDIAPTIKALSPDSQDTLMKYLYKGMGMPGWGDISGSVLLGWHEKLTEIAGTGCIVRTMTDRRTV
ncbi:actin-related protein 2/3 complex subunit 5 [Flagelloscypha sp. PMI_526]|nr:actin-related protein 2/3 complex subunit 5 [Flagelloscypha sp. PMI_526]